MCKRTPDSRDRCSHAPRATAVPLSSLPGIRAPPCASTSAATSPADPPPMTTADKVFSGVVDGMGRVRNSGRHALRFCAELVQRLREPRSNGLASCRPHNSMTCVSHGRAPRLVADLLLHRPNVAPVLQHVRRERVAKHIAAGGLSDSGMAQEGGGLVGRLHRRATPDCVFLYSIRGRIRYARGKAEVVRLSPSPRVQPKFKMPGEVLGKPLIRC